MSAPRSWAACALAATWVACGSAQASEIIFLQFEEQPLVAGDVEDAPNNVSWTLQWFGVDAVTMPAFETAPGEDRDQIIAAIVQTVEAQWAEVDVEIVTERPASGDYMMVTMGGSANLVGLGNAGGWGIVDCYDENKTPIAFVFSERLANDEGLYEITRLAQVVSQEAAHTVGLEHLGGDESFIMYPSTTSASEHVFSTQCEDIVNPIMDEDHPEYCLDHPGCPMGEQNDLAHLIEYIGPAVPGGDDGTGTTTSAATTGSADAGTSETAGPTTDTPGGPGSDGDDDDEVPLPDTDGSGTDSGTGPGQDGESTRGCACSNRSPIDATPGLLAMCVLLRRGRKRT